jgi:hypothetical protein
MWSSEKCFLGRAMCTHLLFISLCRGTVIWVAFSLLCAALDVVQSRARTYILFHDQPRLWQIQLAHKYKSAKDRTAA